MGHKGFFICHSSISPALPGHRAQTPALSLISPEGYAEKQDNLITALISFEDQNKMLQISKYSQQNPLQTVECIQ